MKIRCPHCSNPIEVIDESSFDDVECPSCGSSFNLAKDTETLSYRPAVGKTVAHFELFEHLGTGAFGTVWKAQDTELDRTVAVKVPRKTGLSAEETEQFLREARAAAQIRHPNIVSVHEVGRTDATVYIVADLVEGLTLTDWLSGQSLTPRESAELCLTIVNALHHAHECGVVHRDLKPSNIMLDQNGQPHVMDFGLAKREAGEITVTVEGQILGTPAYMSPEQARGDGHNVDRGSDIYSMGVILFEMLTNERPFRGSVRMLIYQVIYEEAPSPRQFNATVPKDLETICLKCLEKDPAKRFRTAEELGAEFQRFLNGEPILARPVSRIERSWRWSKRNPLIAALSAGLAAILLFLAIAGPVVYFREKTLRVDAVTAANDADRERGKAEGAKEDAEDARNEALEAQELAEVETERARNALASEAAARKASQEAESRAQLEVDKATLHAKAASLARNAVVVSRDSLRKNLYLSQMQSAHAALHDHDLQRVDRLLKNHIPEKDETDLRGFEWFYLRHSQHKAMHWLPYFGQFAVMSPDGSRFASSVRIDDGYAIQLTNATTFLPEFQISLADLSFPNRVAFSPDGSRVFVGHHDSRISSWSLSEGKLLWENAGFDDQRDRITAIDCSPDGLRVAATSGGTTKGQTDVLILDAATGEIVRRLPTGFGFAHSVGFAANDRLIAGAGYGQVFCWNPNTGEQVWDTPLASEVHQDAGRDHYNWVSSIDVAPDKNRFAAGMHYGTVRLYDLETGQVLLEKRGHRTRIDSVAFSHDGSLLATASQDGSCHLRDSTTLRSRGNVVSRKAGFVAAQFSSDDQRLVTSSYSAGVAAWNVAEILAETLHVDSSIGASFLAVSPDSRFLAMNGVEGGVRILDLKVPGSSREFEGVWADRGMKFVTTAEELTLVTLRQDALEIWKVSDGTLLKTIDFPEGTTNPQAFCVSPNGDRVAVGNIMDGEPIIRIWNLDSGELIHELKGSMTYAFGVAFVPDTNELVSVHPASPTMLYRWNLDDGTYTVTGTETGHGPNRKSAFNRDCSLVAASYGNLIQILDPATGEELAKCEGHAADVMALTFLEDGQTLASGADDNTVRLWDVETGQQKFAFRDHTDMVKTLASSPDGETLISAARDRTVRVRRARRSNPLPCDVQKLRMSPDGNFVATAGLQDRIVRVWDRAERSLLLECPPADSNVLGLAFSPDSKLLAVVWKNGNAALRDTTTGDVVSEFSTGTARGGVCDFVDEGKRLVIATGPRFHVYDIQDGTLQTVVREKDTAISQLLWSPGGKHLVSPHHSGVLQVFDADSFTLQTYPALEGVNLEVRLIGENTILECSRDGRIATFDGKTGQLIAESELPINEILATAASADGSRIFVGTVHGVIVELRGDKEDYKEVRRWQDSSLVWELALTPDESELISSTGNGHVTIWDANTGRGLGRLAALGDQAHYTLDVKHTSSQSPSRIANLPWYVEHEIANPDELQNLSGDDLDPGSEGNLFEQTLDARGTDVALSGDGQLIAATVGTQVRVWEADKWEPVHVFDEAKWRQDVVVLSPNASHVVAAGTDQTVRAWRLSDGHQVLEFPMDASVRDMAFIPGSDKLAMVTGPRPSSLYVWDIEPISSPTITGYIELMIRHRWRLDVTADGQYLALAGWTPGSMQIYRTEDLEEVFRTDWLNVKYARFNPANPNEIFVNRHGTNGALVDWTTGTTRSSVPRSRSTFWTPSPDGMKLFMGLPNGHVTIFDVGLGSTIETRPMNHLFRINGQAISSDGNVLATIGGEGIVKLWNSTTGELIRRCE